MFEGVDAVVFAAGSGGHTGADKTMLIDLDGAIKSMEAAMKKDVKRYIMASALGAHKWHKDPDALKSKGYYRAAKFYADDWLEKSGLELYYTIVRPGRLLNDAGTGQVTISENLEHDTIPREDVASVIVSALNNTNTIGKSFDVLSGSTDIDETVKQV